jgi:predicted house-cleaning NTP pyrophosphatase (Maf/HAM1 superfamily)
MSDLPSRHPEALLEEIARLKAENTRLKTEVQHLMVFCNCTLIPNKELQAKVERLTKAGDAMARVVSSFGFDEAPIAWNRAKEGKPRA